MQKFKVSAADVGQRADVFIAGKYPQFTRASLGSLFSGDKVMLGKTVLKPSHRLKQGETLQVDDSLIMAQPEVAEIPLIYEDDKVVVLNKPAGMLTHSKGALNIEPTVASFLATKITDKSLSGNRAGIVHRLDRRTSGVIIGAKNEKALQHLQKQFANRKTSKTYYAVVDGVPDPAEAIIDAPLARNPKRPQTFHVSKEGKLAQTHYNVLKSGKIKNKSYSLLELKPVTGRTHQLRIHLAYIDHPIVGDGIYGHDGPDMLLHAGSLELYLPTGKKKFFEAPLPDSFKEYDL